MPKLAFYLSDIFLLADFDLSEVLVTTRNIGEDVTQVKSELFCLPPVFINFTNFAVCQNNLNTLKMLHIC